jgi:ribosomal protein L40E
MNEHEANAGERLYSAICTKCGAEWVGPHANGPRRCYGDCGHTEFKCTEVTVRIATEATTTKTTAG